MDSIFYKLFGISLLAWILIIVLAQGLAPFISFDSIVYSIMDKNIISSLTSLFISHTIAVILCSIPVSYLVVRWFHEKTALVSIAIGLVILAFIFLPDGVHIKPSLPHQVILALDIIKYPVILVGLSWIFSSYMHNQKTSGQ